MLGGADNPNGELLSYIIGADTARGSILCSHFPASTGLWCSITGGYWQR